MRSPFSARCSEVATGLGCAGRDEDPVRESELRMSVSNRLLAEVNERRDVFAIREAREALAPARQSEERSYLDG